MRKQHKNTFFLPVGQTKALAVGRSPPQELEVSPRSGLYLLVPAYSLVVQFNLVQLKQYENGVTLIHNLKTKAP